MSCEMCGKDRGHEPRCIRYGRRGQYKQARGTRLRIFDQGLRTWTAESRATDEAMNAVLEILMARGTSYQRDIVEELIDVLGCKAGTAAAFTSASLLYFREAGWVRLVEVEGNKAVWELVA